MSEIIHLRLQNIVFSFKLKDVFEKKKASEGGAQKTAGSIQKKENKTKGRGLTAESNNPLYLRKIRANYNPSNIGKIGLLSASKIRKMKKKAKRKHCSKQV